MVVPAEEETVDLGNHSAIELFVQRARQAGLKDYSAGDLKIIGKICQLLGGMPLAIELAAGWVRTYTCAQIAAEIERDLNFLTTSIQNVPDRHRSLQVAFDHSWRLLPNEAQETFARTTVFRDGFDHEAAQFVAESSPMVLANLVDHSMLQISNGRFQTNEILRQIGAEKLVNEVRSQVSERHAHYFAAYLEQRERHKWTALEPVALMEIRLVLKDILGGWQWASTCLMESKEGETGLTLISRYTSMLTHFYDQGNRYHEGVRLFQQAAETIAKAENYQSPQSESVLAQVEAAEAVFRFHLGQFSDVEKLLEKCLTTFKTADNQLETARALLWFGMTANRLGAFGDANQYFQDSLGLFQHLDQRPASAEALNGLGIVAISQERFEDALQILHECLSIYMETGYERGIARTLSNLGTAHIRSKNHDPALPLYEKALAAARKINDTLVIAVVLSNLGSISGIVGKHQDSLQYYRESLALFEEMGERRWIAVNFNGLGETLLEMGQIEKAEEQLLQALELSNAIQSLPDSLDSLAALGEISAVSGNFQQAINRLTYVVNQSVAKPLARARADRVLAQLKQEMTPEAWRAAQDKLTQTPF